MPVMTRRVSTTLPPEAESPTVSCVATPCTVREAEGARVGDARTPAVCRQQAEAVARHSPPRGHQLSPGHRPGSRLVAVRSPDPDTVTMPRLV